MGTEKECLRKPVMKEMTDRNLTESDLADLAKAGIVPSAGQNNHEKTPVKTATKLNK